jgi:hypothetical protein
MRRLAAWTARKERPRADPALLAALTTHLSRELPPVPVDDKLPDRLREALIALQGFDDTLSPPASRPASPERRTTGRLGQ